MFLYGLKNHSMSHTKVKIRSMFSPRPKKSFYVFRYPQIRSGLYKDSLQNILCFVGGLKNILCFKDNTSVGILYVIKVIEIHSMFYNSRLVFLCFRERPKIHSRFHGGPQNDSMFSRML